MNRYTFAFTGRAKGAIGVFHGCTQTVEAETREAAELKLYDTHDHVHLPSLIDFWAPGMPEKGETP